MKPGETFRLKDFDLLVEVVKLLGDGRVEVAFLPEKRSTLIVTADRSLVPE